jgi:hypothetical protein
MFLAYHLLECHRPVFSGEDHVTHVNQADECFEGSRVPLKLNNILSQFLGNAKLKSRGKWKARKPLGIVTA